MTRCPETTEEGGVPCQRQLHVDRDGVEYDFHSGGHQFATDEVWARMHTWHYDAGSLLAGLPTVGHPPEECPGPAECSTALYRDVSPRTR